MPGGSKKGGGLEVGSAYKMKNTELASSMKYKTPMQKNYASPAKKETPTDEELMAMADAKFGDNLKVKQVSDADFNAGKRDYQSRRSNQSDTWASLSDADKKKQINRVKNK